MISNTYVVGNDMSSDKTTFYVAICFMMFAILLAPIMSKALKMPKEK